MSELLRLDALRLDGGTQSRAAIDAATVAEYADAVDALPPIVAFYDGEHYWLADGFHRVRASIAAERAKIPADVRQGTQRDAVLYSVGANASHGLRRTNADKRRAVATLLDDAEWSAKGDRFIAKACGVSHTFVQERRAATGNVASSRLGQDGKTRRVPERRATAEHPPASTAPALPVAPGAPAPLPVADESDDDAGFDGHSAASRLHETIGAAFDSWPSAETMIPLHTVLADWTKRVERRISGRSAA